MNHTEDFVIQDGILLEYIGDDSVVRVPDGVRGISWDAFREASPKELVLPEGLVWISDFAFSRLNSLRRLVLPGTLRTVPQGLCHQADNLEEVVIPEGVVCLSNMAFAETALPRVTIPDSVEVIGYACFQGCRHLEEVSLGRGIRYLAGSMFKSCINLSTISLPDSLLFIDCEAFRRCANLRSVHLGQGLVSLSFNLLSACPRLEEVRFPDTLETLWSDVFGQSRFCRRLTLPGNRVGILEPSDSSGLCPASIIRAPRMLPEWFPPAFRPAALKGYRELKKEGAPLNPEIAEAWEAFAAGADPDVLEELTEPFRVVDGVLCEAACTKGRVVVPDGVIGIRAEVFQGTAVREVYLPDSVQWIHAGAFMGCARLKSVRLPAGLAWISENLFRECPKLRSIRLPDHLVLIGEGAFAESGLETISLPPSLKTISTSAFAECHQLKRIRFSEGLREILTQAFSDCTSLTEVVLPDSLLHLDSEAFSDCTALKRVSIGAGVSCVEEDTFGGCYELDEVILSAEMIHLVDRCFGDYYTNVPRVRLACTYMESETTLTEIIAPNADPDLFDSFSTSSLLQGFASEGGRGYRFEDEYLELLRSNRESVWYSRDGLRLLLSHDMLEREDIPECLETLQKVGKPDLVAEVLEYCHRRFPEPAPRYLE